MKTPKISVLLPTRKRIDSLRRSVESLQSTCTQSELEFLLFLDDDDTETIEAIERDPIADSKVLLAPRKGYIKLHEYVNSLCEIAEGDWLFLWNDDAIMETHGWDAIVGSFNGQFVVVNPETNHANHPRENCIFPIVPRKWFELLDHFALSNHNDTYVEQIANTLGIRRDVEIRVRHDRADLTGANDDEVYAERQFSTSEFYGPANQENIGRDIETIAKHLQAQKRMKIGFVGLGKLGLPCALAIEKYGGHKVYGWDPSEAVQGYIRDRKVPYKEEAVPELLESTNLQVICIDELVQRCDIIFVAVQTPHDPRFEGTTPLPEDRADFDYSFLIAAVHEVAKAASNAKREIVLAVISTVLPGTIEREIRPLLNEFTCLAYHPFFIAMGTTIEDFMNPEFVLLGSDSERASEAMKRFYSSLHEAEVVETSIESAELIKVAYNTFIGMKIVFANTLMEICDGTRADVDEICGALAKATKRIISPKYMSAGMGDGGGCHPRDNIAMSHLARQRGLSFDLFECIMKAREEQTKWLANKVVRAATASGLPVIVLGKSFKAGSNLTVGSPALLLSNILQNMQVPHEVFDPHVDLESDKPIKPAVYVVATNHPEFQNWQFPSGSVVIDPWNHVEDTAEVRVSRIGRTT